MKIKDIIAHRLIETELFEMAFRRRVVLDKIRSLQLQIAYHLIKHIYYDVPDETKRHWEQEINAWLSTIDDYRLKKGRTLDASVYYYHLFSEPLKERRALVRYITKINQDPKMQAKEGLVSVGHLHERIEGVLHDVSYDLANESLKDISHYLRSDDPTQNNDE